VLRHTGQATTAHCAIAVGSAVLQVDASVNTSACADRFALALFLSVLHRHLLRPLF
jgi:hypothetical protein